MQLSSHNWPRDSKEELVIPSKTCAVEAFVDRVGCSWRVPEWVACMMSSLGKRTEGPVDVG